MSRHRAYASKRRTHRALRILVALFLCFSSTSFLTFTAAGSAGAVTIGGFEIDGNMSSEGGLDWATVGGQPIANDFVRNVLDDNFKSGSTAKELNPGNWDLENTEVTPVANDVGDLYGYGTLYGDSQYVFLGFERATNGGTIQFNLELNQLPNTTNANGTSVPDRSPGDILIDITQQGSSGFSVNNVYEWTGSDWSLISGGTSAIVGATNLSPITDVDGNTLAAGTFAEIAVNLTDLFDVPSCPGKNFSAANIRSRASQSVTSDLKDYVSPGVISVPDSCGELSIEKLDEQGSRIGGATFTIDPNPIPGEPDSPALTVVDGGTGDPDGTADGVVYFEDAKPATYTITETAPPLGYIMGDDAVRTEELESQGTLTVSFTNELGSFAWTKVDGDGGNALLGGAEFTLEATGGAAATLLSPNPLTVVDNGPYDADPDAGEFLVDDLYTGHYTLTESQQPTGYVQPDPWPSHSFTISADNQDASWENPVVNYRKKSMLTVQKVDADTGAALGGVTFELFREAGEPGRGDDVSHGTCTTTLPSGTCSIDKLPFGTYYWVELAPPTGYQAAGTPDPESITISAENAGTTLTTTVVSNAQIRSHLKVKKVDADNDDAPLAGAEFTLYDTNGTPNDTSDDTVAGTCVTALPNGTCTVGDLLFGTYYWVETRAPEGYAPADPATSDLITVDPQNAGSTFPVVTFANHQLRSELTVKKIDAVDHSLLDGAMFSLYREEGATDALMGTCVTGADGPGLCTIGGLKFGTYYWVEDMPPTGYLPAGSPTPESITIDASNAGDVQTVTVFANPRVGSALSVEKHDTTLDGALLDGAVFKLWLDEDGDGDRTTGTQSSDPDWTCTTGEVGSDPGTCTLSGLTFGTYYWEELAAPTGYDLPADVYSDPITITAANAGTTLPVRKFADPRTPSELVVKKLDESDHAPLAGADFTLWLDEDGDGDRTTGTQTSEPGWTCTTGADGTCGVTGLDFGTYYWQETAAPTGYNLPADVYSDPITITAANAGTVLPVRTFHDPRKLSALGVEKVDASDEAPLAGAEFTLFRDEDGDGDRTTGTQTSEPGWTCTTGADGTCAVTGLDFGTYYWQETAAPTGYDLPADVYSEPFTIDASNADDTAGVVLDVARFADPRKPSDLKVEKVDASDDTPLAGADFTLWLDEDGDGDRTTGTQTSEPGWTCTTGADGTCAVTGLDFGTYYWQETAAPTGYDLPADVYSDPITITAANAGTVLDVSRFSDPRKPSELWVKKVDAQDQEVTLDGAVFRLWLDLGPAGVSPEDTSEEGWTCTTDTDGLCGIAGLDFGTYYWEEIQAPDGYVLPDPHPYSESVAIDASNAGTVLPTRLFLDSHQLSTLGVKKVDAQDESRVLEGAEFTLFRDEDGDGDRTTGVQSSEPGWSCTTSAAGTCLVTGLDFGTYYWQETAAPTGYDLPADVYSEAFTIDASNADDTPGTVLDVAVFSDPRTPSELTVEKVDAEDGTLLSGAAFTLFADSDGSGDETGEDTEIGTCTTDDTGRCTVGGLDFGDYYWQETAAPAGYDLPADVYSDLVTIDASNAGTALTVTRFADPRQDVSLTVHKTDAQTGKALDTAYFRLWLDDGDGSFDPDRDIMVEDETPTMGGSLTWTGLGWNTYFVEETRAPQGYDLPSDAVQKVVLSRDEAGGTVEITFADPRIGTRLVAVKVDAEDGTRLAGAQFQLWSDDGDGVLEPTTDTRLGDPVTTGDVGTAAWPNLDFGDYLVEEVVAPKGYYLPDPHPVQAVTVTRGNAGQTVTLRFEDPRMGSLLIEKQQFYDYGTGEEEITREIGYASPITYRLTVTSTGPNAEHDVVVTDYVPGYHPDDTTTTASASLVRGSQRCLGGGPCVMSYDADQHLLTWELGDLAAGESRTVEFQVRLALPTMPTTPGEFTEDVWNVAAASSVEHPSVPSNEVVATTLVEVLAPPPTPNPPTPNPPPAPNPPPTPTPPGLPLPPTGAPEDMLTLLGTGLLAILTGAGILYLTRRRLPR